METRSPCFAGCRPGPRRTSTRFKTRGAACLDGSRRSYRGPEWVLLCRAVRTPMGEYFADALAMIWKARGIRLITTMDTAAKVIARQAGEPLFFLDKSLMFRVRERMGVLPLLRWVLAALLAIHTPSSLAFSAFVVGGVPGAGLLRGYRARGCPLFGSSLALDPFVRCDMAEITPCRAPGCVPSPMPVRHLRSVCKSQSLRRVGAGVCGRPQPEEVLSGSGARGSRTGIAGDSAVRWGTGGSCGQRVGGVCWAWRAHRKINRGYDLKDRRWQHASTMTIAW